jgi:uncharacterized protein YndB with AHSA1/START domain
MMNWKSIAGIAGASLLTFVVMLWVIGFRPSAGHVEASVEIDRIYLQVWPWIVQPDRQKQWIAGLVEVRQAGPMRLTWILRDGGTQVEIQSEVTEQDPPFKWIRRIHTPGRFSGISQYHVVELAEGRTKVELIEDYKYDSWFTRLLEPLSTPRAKEKWQENLERLKRKVESGS